jgi:hypothetical protein
MRLITKDWLVILLISQLLGFPSKTGFGAELSGVPSMPSNVGQGQSQFVFKPIKEQYLIPVEVIGAVRSAGVHYIPPNTRLTKLLALVGGIDQDAETDRILVKRYENKKYIQLTLDLDAYMENLNTPNATNSFQAKLNDVIYVPRREPFIDRDLVSTVQIVGSVASLVLSFFVIDKAFSGK